MKDISTGLALAVLILAAPIAMARAPRVKNTTACPNIYAACCMPRHPSSDLACELMIKKDPGSPVALYYRASAHYQVIWRDGSKSDGISSEKYMGIHVGKDPKKMIADYEKALTSGHKRHQNLPDEAAAHERLGYGYASLFNWDSAIANWQSAIKLRPELGGQLMQRISFAEARRKERREIRASPPTDCTTLSYWSCEEAPHCMRSMGASCKGCSDIAYLGCVARKL